MLKDKTILITGASSGIGRNGALLFAEHGAKVILVARSNDKLKDLQTDINNLGEKSVLFPFDLSDVDGIKPLFKEMKAVLSGALIHGFFHCAGNSPLRPLKYHTFSVMQDVFKINLYSFVELCRCFAEQKFTDDEKGSIVGVSSIAATACDAGRLAYSASKCALESSIKVIAKELVAKKIRVNSIAPAMVDTPMAKEYLDLIGEEASQNFFLKFQPLGLITPEAISMMALYLLSDRSEFITGSSIPVTAGM